MSVPDNDIAAIRKSRNSKMNLGNFFAELKRRNVYNSPIGESYVLNRNRSLNPEFWR